MEIFDIRVHVCGGYGNTEDISASSQNLMNLVMKKQQSFHKYIPSWGVLFLGLVLHIGEFTIEDNLNIVKGFSPLTIN